MTQDTLKTIDSKLDAILRILALGLLEGKSKTESIVTLGRVGLDRKLIAEMVGTTPKVVSTRLSEAKKKGARKKG